MKKLMEISMISATQRSRVFSMNWIASRFLPLVMGRRLKREVSNSLTMTPDTWVSGAPSRTTGMAKESRSGMMVQCMRVSGRMTRLMEKEDLSMLMEMSMKEIGSMIRLMERESIPTLMELNM